MRTYEYALYRKKKDHTSIAIVDYWGEIQFGVKPVKHAKPYIKRRESFKDFKSAVKSLETDGYEDVHPKEW